jgi:hypothetical protein
MWCCGDADVAVRLQEGRAGPVGIDVVYGMNDGMIDV